jgi:tetratricopeptide (TPR) repeat protein
MGSYADAESQLRRSLALGETGEALNTLGIVLTHQGRDEEASGFIARALEKFPGRFLWWINLGAAYRRLHRLAEAGRANRKALELAEAEMRKYPWNGYVRSCVAYLYAWLDLPGRAELEIAEALQLSPQDSDARLMAVKTYEALGLRDDALTVLNNSSPGLLADVNRHPDLAALRADSRFQKMISSGPVR